MVSLDSCFLIDLLDGDSGAVRTAEDLDNTGQTKFVTAPAAAEVLLGGSYLGGTYLARTRSLIDRLGLLSFDREAYHEAARIGAALLSTGTPIGQADLSVAAISKRHGEPVITRDPVFARIPGLSVVSY